MKFIKLTYEDKDTVYINMDMVQGFELVTFSTHSRTRITLAGTTMLAMETPEQILALLNE